MKRFFTALSLGLLSAAVANAQPKATDNKAPTGNEPKITEGRGTGAAEPKVTEAKTAVPQVTEGKATVMPVITNGVVPAAPTAVTSAGYLGFSSNLVTPTALIGTSNMTYAAPPVIPFSGSPVMAIQSPLLSQGGNNSNMLVEPAGVTSYASAVSPGFSYAYQSAPVFPIAPVGNDVGLASLNSQPVGIISGTVSNRISTDFGSFRPTGSFSSYAYPVWR